MTPWAGSETLGRDPHEVGETASGLPGPPEPKVRCGRPVSPPVPLRPGTWKRYYGT